MQRETLTKKQWSKVVLKILKAELVKRGINYVDLKEKLEAIGVNESIETIRNKMVRGTFSAIFLVQCLRAIGVEEMQMGDVFFRE